jgi:dihydrofolate synthase/folylpolyglutamate synthase
VSELDEILARLHHLHPLLIDLSLGRVERLLDKLGRPHDRFPPTIHIAGTNGKGSTTAYLKAMLEAAGQRVHVYTSPHLVRFAERIAVPGHDGIARPIDEALLTDYLRRIETVNSGEPITFFEVTMAAAFLAFAELPADAVLLEVGLGGEFDSTNVIACPAVAVITPVDMDHAEKLGPTLPLIAKAKAGIIKRGAPVVVSLQRPEALEVIEAKAQELAAPATVWGRDYEAFAQRGRLVWQSEDELLDLPMPALLGRHQIVNAGTAVAAARRFGARGIPEASIARGLLEVQWPARMQRLAGGPMARLLPGDWELWLDGGHNPHAAEALAQTLADLEERSPKPLALVVGLMGQKDSAGFLTPFRGLARRLVAVPVPGAHERPHAPADLAGLAASLGFVAETAAGVPEAIAHLGRTSAAPMRVLICGSLYLAGTVLAHESGTKVQSN